VPCSCNSVIYLSFFIQFLILMHSPNITSTMHSLFIDSMYLFLYSVPYSDVFPRHNQHNAFVFYLLHPSFLTVRRPLVAWSYVMCKQRGLLSILKEVCPEKRAHWQAPGRLVKATMRRRARALGKGMSWRESIRLLSAIFSPSSIALCFRGRQGTVQVCQVPFRIIRRLRSV